MNQDPVSTANIGRGVLIPEHIAPTPVALGSEGIEYVHVFDIPDAATNVYEVVMTQRFEVLDVLVQKRGGAGGAVNTVTVQHENDPITDAMSINVADKTLVRPLTIDDAFSIVLRLNVLRISVVKAGGNAACLVMVRGIVRPG